MSPTNQLPDPNSLTLAECGQAFLNGLTFTDEKFFHAITTRLRKESPIQWVEHENFNPFYVVTKHADVLEIELHNNIFLNAPRAVLGDKHADAERAMQGHLVKSLVQMDDPEHRDHRALTSDWFLPKNLAKLDARLQELADRSVQQMIDKGGRCDFAADIAMQYPLYVILAILGLPESDYPRMLKLTQELFGAEDPDFKRDDNALQGILQTVAEFFAYFDQLTAERGERGAQSSTCASTNERRERGQTLIGREPSLELLNRLRCRALLRPEYTGCPALATAASIRSSVFVTSDHAVTACFCGTNTT